MSYQQWPGNDQQNQQQFYAAQNQMGAQNLIGTQWAQPAPTNLQPAPQAVYSAPVDSVWTAQHAAATNTRVNVILLISIAGGLAGLFFLIFGLPNLLESAGGPAGMMIGFFLSLFPLAAVLLSVYVIDRWEPEPKWMLAFALFWGAAGSIATTLLIQPVWVSLFAPHFTSKADQLSWLGSFEAPPVEEFSKGIGILLIALFARRYFDGPLDGIVYGSTIAAGFAFTENIQYFGAQFFSTEGDIFSVGLVFLVRGIFSPFNHALFTACTGVAIGFGARRRGPWPMIGMFFVGLVPAMIFHHVWNTAHFESYFTISTDAQAIGVLFLQSFVLETPLIAGWIIFIYFLRRGEVRLTRLRLSEYAANGWFTPDEVTMVASPQGRRNALAWSRRFGRATPMRAFIRAATHLAYTRQRIVTGSQVRSNQFDELALLDSITRLRPHLVG